MNSRNSTSTFDMYGVAILVLLKICTGGYLFTLANQTGSYCISKFNLAPITVIKYITKIY